METSPFLKLPAELRKCIYELALIKQGPITVDRKKRKLGISPLLQTCRQIRAEASAIYFGRNTFKVGYDLENCSYDSLVKWLSSLQREHREALRRIRIGGICCFPQFIEANAWSLRRVVEETDVDAGKVEVMLLVRVEDAAGMIVRCEWRRI